MLPIPITAVTSDTEFKTLKPLTLRRRFGHGVIWNTAAVAFNQGSTFAANLLLANVLGRAGFGAYAIVLSTSQAVAQLASLGMGSTATRYLAEYRAANRDRAEAILGFTFSVAISSAVVAGVAVGIGGGWVAAHVLMAPQLGQLLRVAGIAVLFSVMNGYLMGALAGLERFQSLGRTNAFAGLLYVGLAAVGAYEWGIAGAVWGLAISGAAQCLLLYVAFRRAIEAAALVARRSEIGQDAAIITRWVVPGVLGGFTSTAALWGLQALLTRRPDGLSAVAIYGAAYNLMTVVLFLPNVANSVGMTLLNNLLGARDAGQYRRFFWHNMKATLAVVVVGAAFLGIMGHVLLRMYGRAFEPGFIPLLVLLAATIPESLTIALSQVVLAQERIWTSIISVNAPRDLLIVIMALILIPVYGVLGAALAYLGGRLIGLAATGLLVAHLGLRLPPARVPLIRTEPGLQ